MIEGADSKHTPGPWKACPPRFGHQFVVRQDPKNWDGHGYQHICTLPQLTKGTHYGEMFKANANLIAAAPDLLEVLRRIDHTLTVHGHFDSGTDLHDNVRAAIAAAICNCPMVEARG
jgi:hypothetical protein